MAELAIKIGDSAGYVDGDILCAFSDNRISQVHIEKLCNVKLAGGGVSAHRDANHIAFDFLLETSKYRFDRVSESEVVRTTLETSVTVTLDNTPQEIDGSMQGMDVALFVSRRLNHPAHRIFGVPGAEIWFGGTRAISSVELSAVWDAIETKTANVRSDESFSLWPVGAQDLKASFFISSDDFDLAAAEQLVQSVYADEDPVDPDLSQELLSKRARYVEWRDITGLSTGTQDSVVNTSVAVDVRGPGHVNLLSTVVVEKP